MLEADETISCVDLCIRITFLGLSFDTMNYPMFYITISESVRAELLMKVFIPNLFSMELVGHVRLTPEALAEFGHSTVEKVNCRILESEEGFA